ncbi:uncharacterized protein LOC126836099 isoform X2 [Adelges cooleyi]|uniref:uncharacterized protein LOC126836099 isoform X2 n=1 Tax=Adelges cooleyi TaxID=133065 RepID=UPI00217F83C4|nr:uncharacterized protein LOC126836099 isoform X2 [Adelges cooleyi]
MVDSSKTAKLQLKMRPRSPIIMSGRSKIGICESSLKSVNKLDKNTKYSVLPDESPIVHMQNRPKKFKYSNLQSTPYAQNIKKSITESREIINLSPIAATSTTVIDNPVNGTDIFPCHLLKCKREIPMDCSIDPNTSKINNSKEIKSKLKFSTHLKAQSPESNLCEPLMISEIANKKSLKHKNENTKRCLFENEKLSSSNSDMDQDSLNISLDTLEQVCQMSERTLECSNKNVNNLVSFLYGNTSTKLENTVVENDLLRLALKMEDFITNEKKPKKVLEVETNFTTLNKLQKNENTSFQNSKKCKNDNVHSTFFTNSTQLTTNNLMSTNEIGNTQMCEIADIIEPLSSFDDQWTQQYTLNSNIQVSSSSNCNQGAVHNLKLKCDVQSSNNEHKYSYTYKSENKMYKPLTENTEFSTPENNSLNILKRATHKSEVLVKDDKTSLSNEKLKPLNIPQATTNEFKGFSTATGKAIKVPEQALRQAEALLKDDQAQSLNVKLKTLSRVDEASNKFKGFSTATGKSIKISAKALHKVETLLNDDETQLLNKRVNPLNIPQATTNEFKGFSTATGKAIKVPEQALRQAEALLKDDQAQSSNVKLKTLSRVDEASNKFKGFSTATGKSIKISAKALHKVETLLNDDETQLLNKRVNPLNIPQATTNEFKGFSTATGKAIKVPEQALRQVEALLKDDQAQSTNGSFNILVKADEPSNKLKSFSTDKSVMISENTTQMAQIVFKDGNCVVNKLSSYNDNLLKIDNKKKILQSVSKCNIGKSDILGNIEDMNVEIIDEFFSNDSFILSENKLLGTGNKPAFKELQNLKNTTHNSTHDKKSLNDGLNDTQSILEDISLVDTVERIEKGQQHFLNTTSHNKRPGSPNYDIEKIIKKPILDFGWEKNELEKSFKVYLSKKLSSQKTSLSTLVDYSLPKKSTANQHFNGNYDFANFDSNKSLDFKLCWDYNRSNTEANFYNFNNIKNLFESHFLVDVKLIPKSWVENHFHWIIWKLASMELSFPNLFANKLLTAKNTIHELLYRYYREIEKCQRSVLKKILEKDDVATKRMILCVSKIIKSNTAENYNIELTDGWYKVQGLLDSEMNTLVHRQVVRVGTKLLISNAELVGAGEGIDPLQVHDGVKLKISTNSTRRVRWYAKLGLCKYPTSPVPISLESVLPHGGTIGSLSLVVLRKYPMLYFERKLNSKSVFRNEKMEIFEEEKHKTTQQKNLEKISNNIQSEMERELMSKTKNKIKLIKITKENIKNYSIEELSDIIENCMDPSEIQSVISEDKLEAIQNYKKTQHDNFMYELKKRVDNVFNDQFKDNKRRVTPLLKLRVVDEKDACSGLNFAVLTIWNPSESVSMFFDTISEGHCCVFSHLTATGYMNGELQLSAGKQSHYVFKKIINNYAKRAVISAKTFWSGSFSPLYSELDLVGIVIGIIKENETFNEVYVTDTEMNIVSIVFRGDFKEFGCDDKMLYPGSIISGMNLVFKGFHSNTPIPKVYVTELSLFTTVPKAEHLKQCSDDYIKFLKNSENFIQLCQNKIVEFQNKKSDVPSHDIDVYSLNVANKKIQKPYGESPSAAVSSPHVFQSEFSPVRKRLKMLNAYGKTPPLNIIHTKPPNKKLMNQFKTPNRM